MILREDKRNKKKKHKNIRLDIYGNKLKEVKKC